MNKRAEVTIVMATYNGEAHLREQLDSLLSQTYRDWRLLIHDDGSADRTPAILDEYIQRDSRITLLDDGVTGLGAARNFLHLLHHVDTDFCMFCDQDDVWLGDKVGKMVAAILPLEGAAAVYSNSHLYIGGQVIRQMSTQIHPSTLRNTLFLNSGMQGCAMIFNRRLLEVLKPFPNIVAMHDHLFTLGAIAFGKLVYLDEVLTLYRQHEKNVTGNQELGGRRRVTSFFAPSKAVISRSHYDANHAFFEQYEMEFDNSSRNLFRQYFKYGTNASKLQRVLILLKNRFTLGDKIGVLLLKTMLRRAID